MHTITEQTRPEHRSPGSFTDLNRNRIGACHRLLQAFVQASKSSSAWSTNIPSKYVYERIVLATNYSWNGSDADPSDTDQRGERDLRFKRVKSRHGKLNVVIINPRSPANMQDEAPKEQPYLVNIIPQYSVGKYGLKQRSRRVKRCVHDPPVTTY